MEYVDSHRFNIMHFLAENFIQEQLMLSTVSDIGNDLATCVQECLDDPPELEGSGKSDRHSIISIIKGDQYMKCAAYEEAANAYTLGLQHAYAYSKSSAMCYAKRSAALQKLKAYDDSLLDIERALQLPLSETLKIEITRRKEQLSQDLNKERSSNAEQQQQQQQQPATKKNRDAETTLSHGESKEVPGASSAIAIAYNETYGRHFVATKGIKAGDVLLIQQPCIAVASNLFKESTICYQCLRYTRVPIPCERCTMMLYCSTECRSEAYEKYHSIECGVLTSEYLFPLLRVLIMITDRGMSLEDIKKCVEEISKSEDPRKAGFTGDQFIGNSTKALLSVTHHEDDVMTCITAYQIAHLAVLLRNYTDFLHGSNDVLGLAKLMLHVGCILENCMKTIKCVRQDGVDYVKRLYPVFELLNHSCVSNTITYDLEDKRRVLRASKDIEAGEQIFINYINLRTLVFQNASNRKNMIMEIYHFRCRCEACSSNYSFTMELKKKLKLPVRLQRRLKKAPINIESMWELLNLLQCEIRQPSLEVEIMKFALSRAYMNEENEFLRSLYTRLGVF